MTTLDLGSKHLGASIDNRVLTVHIGRTERRNAMNQDRTGATATPVRKVSCPVNR
ncbi:MAG: hypothetical protein HRU01_16835 [Myxococcales bacterium]|nr:hypothetical protein [Myxococcales bacterium]